MCWFLCLSKRVCIRLFLKLFVSLEFLSDFSKLFQSLTDLTENVCPPSVELLYMGQHRFSLLKCVFLEWTSEFSWSIDFRYSGVLLSVLLRINVHLLTYMSYRKEANLMCWTTAMSVSVILCPRWSLQLFSVV